MRSHWSGGGSGRGADLALLALPGALDIADGLAGHPGVAPQTLTAAEELLARVALPGAGVVVADVQAMTGGELSALLERIEASRGSWALLLLAHPEAVAANSRHLARAAVHLMLHPMPPGALGDRIAELLGRIGSYQTLQDSARFAEPADPASLVLDLVGRLAHDLRSPLASIIMNSQSGTSGALDTADAEVLDDISAAALEIERHLANLIDVANASSGHWRPVLGPLDPGLVVRRAAAALRELGSGFDIAVDTRVDQTVPTVLASSSLLERMLTTVGSVMLAQLRAGDRLTLGCDPRGDAGGITLAAPPGRALTLAPFAGSAGRLQDAATRGGLGPAFVRAAARAQGLQISLPEAGQVLITLPLPIVPAPPPPPTPPRPQRSRQVARAEHDLLTAHDEAPADRAGLSQELDRALRGATMVWQPIVRWSQRRIVAFEAFVRGGTAPLRLPADLFAAAERLGRTGDLMGRIGDLLEADVTAAPPQVDLFVNIEPCVALDSAESPLTPLERFAARVVLDLTRPPEARPVGPADLAPLRALGFRLALGDLGRGDGAAERLATLEPEFVWLGADLLRGVRRTGLRAQAIARLVATCRGLGAPVIAKGVETAAERELLVGLGCKCSAMPVHPGYSATNLQSAGVGMDGGSALFRWVYKITNALMAQSAEAGAYPLVLAAAWPDAKPGAYYGPTGLQQLRGPVGESFVHDKAKDEAMARGLWEKSEELVGAFFGE